MVSEWIKHHEGRRWIQRVMLREREGVREMNVDILLIKRPAGRVLCTAESHVAAKRLVDALQGLPVMHMRWTGDSWICVRAKAETTKAEHHSWRQRFSTTCDAGDVPWSELQRQLQAARVVVATCTGAGWQFAHDYTVSPCWKGSMDKI